jgi:uracil-DNA glycosylase
LLGRNAIPGIDFALAEVVHCKSGNRIGVPEAVHECARRYLTQVLNMSAATVVVFVGKYAAERVREFFAIRGISRMVGPSIVAGQRRLLLFLDAPVSSKRRILTGVLEEQQIQ